MPVLHKSIVAEAPGGAAPAGGARFAEHLVLLAHDDSLIESLSSVVPQGSLTVVADDAALAQHLLSGHVGVVFIDAGAAHSAGATAQLTQRLHQQLPDVVLVVAGDGAAQGELSAQVAEGTIYRFVHKPVSPQRMKLFVDAAWRKRDNGASGLYPQLSMSPLPPPPPASPPQGFPWPAAVAGALVVGASVAWLLLRPNLHHQTDVPPPALSATQRPLAESHLAPLASPAAPAVSPASAPSAAADLDRLATAAEQALLAGDLADASRLTDAARAIDPQHVRVRFLSAQVAREQSRAAARRHAAEQADADAVAERSRPQTPAEPQLTQIPVVPPAAASAPEPTPVVAVSVTTTHDVTVAPSSTPPASEARDPNSVAAVILQRVYAVDPVFPEVARAEDLKGFVDLEFTVRADGTVTDVNVLKSSPIGVFERAAVDAVAKWRYRPVERDGVPVSEHARLRLNFAYK